MVITLKQPLILYMVVTSRLIDLVFLQVGTKTPCGLAHGWLQSLAPSVNFGQGSCQLQLKINTIS